MEKRDENVPKLRFPEFGQNWSEQKIKTSYMLVSGQHLNPDEYSKVIRNTTPYFTGPSDFTNDENKVNKWSLKEGKMASKGDLLITVKGNGVGTMMLLNLTKIVMGRQLMALTSQVASTTLLFHYLQLRKEYFEKLAAGNMIPGLSRKDIQETKIKLPTLPEQQKIANFLTAVDQKIEQLSKKVDLLKQYKKGVMQQIFNQEIRFKADDGSDFPEWEEKRLEDYTKKISSGKTKPSDTGNFHVFGSRGIIGSAEKYTHSGEFLLVARVGANAGFLRKVKGSFCVTDNTLVIDIKKNISNIKFIYYSMDHYNLNQLVFGSGQPLITSKQLKSILLKMPSLPEQQKIASFLTTIDQKITQVTTQLEKTKAFKKGLLQQMFV
ncbi:MAG: restriction endonuclease subunit S [Flammeovirgaceae bacterium]